MYRDRTIRATQPTITLPELGALTIMQGELQDPGLRDFNPSVAWHEGRLMISIRRCNFAINPRGNWYLRDGNAFSTTDVIYAEVNPDTYKIHGYHKLNLKNAPVRTQVCGLEDVRLFSRKDGMHAIGFESDRITKSLHNSTAKMAEYLVDGRELVFLRTLDKPNDLIPEKNWCPTDLLSDKFDFTYSDTQVWKDGKVIGQPSRTQIHGGSQLLKQKEGYLSVVHEKVGDRMGRFYDRFKYVSYLAKHSDEGFITHLSKPFRFGTNENIEFASGMVEYNGKLIISYGIRDAKFALCIIDKEKVMELFV